MISSISKIKVRRIFPYLFNAILFLILLFVISYVNRDWIFSRGGMDGWMYLGYFKHYDTAQFLGSNKKIARLPWILVGYYTHRIFPDLLSAYILRLGIILLTSVMLFSVLVKLSNQLTAFLLTLGYITYQPALGSGGWDYHNAFSGLLFVTSYYLILSSVSLPPSKIRFFVTGLFIALTIHTNILFALIFLPIFFIKLYYLYRTLSIRTLIFVVISPASLGGVFITIILGLINFIHGRQFFFFTILAGRSAQLLSHPSLESSWWRSWDSLWWIRSEQVILWEIIFTLMGLWVFLNFIKGKPFARFQDFSFKKQILLEFFLAFFLFFIFQSLGHPVLQPYYMAYPLYLPSFLALTVLIDLVIWIPDEEYPVSLLYQTLIKLIIFIIFLIIFLILITNKFSLDTWSTKIFFDTRQTGYILVIDLILCLSAMIIATTTRTTNKLNSVKLISTYILILLFFAFNNSRFPAYSYSHLNCNSAQELYKFVNKIDSIFFPIFKSGRNIRIIFNDHERIISPNGCSIGIANLGYALDSMGYNGALLLTGVFEKDQKTIKPFLQKTDPQKDIFVVLSSNSHLFNEIKAIASTQGIYVSIDKSHKFYSLGKEVISLNILKIKLK